MLSHHKEILIQGSDGNNEWFCFSSEYRCVKARNRFGTRKNVHIELVLLALKLKHKFGISLALLLAASNDPFNHFNGSEIVLRINSLDKHLNMYSIC